MGRQVKRALQTTVCRRLVLHRTERLYKGGRVSGKASENKRQDDSQDMVGFSLCPCKHLGTSTANPDTNDIDIMSSS